MMEAGEDDEEDTDCRGSWTSSLHTTSGLGRCWWREVMRLGTWTGEHWLRRTEMIQLLLREWLPLWNSSSNFPAANSWLTLIIIKQSLLTRLTMLNYVESPDLLRLKFLLVCLTLLVNYFYTFFFTYSCPW